MATISLESFAYILYKNGPKLLKTANAVRDSWTKSKDEGQSNAAAAWTSLVPLMQALVSVDAKSDASFRSSVLGSSDTAFKIANALELTEREVLTDTVSVTTEAGVQFQSLSDAIYNGSGLDLAVIDVVADNSLESNSAADQATELAELNKARELSSGQTRASDAESIASVVGSMVGVYVEAKPAGKLFKTQPTKELPKAGDMPPSGATNMDTIYLVQGDESSSINSPSGIVVLPKGMIDHIANLARIWKCSPLDAAFAVRSCGVIMGSGNIEMVVTAMYQAERF